MKINERNDKFYTMEGLNALKVRLKVLVDFYNKGKFPMNTRLYGFGSLVLKSKDDCMSRIDEICDLIGWELDKKTESFNTVNGTKKREVLVY